MTVTVFLTLVAAAAATIAKISSDFEDDQQQEISRIDSEEEYDVLSHAEPLRDWGTRKTE